MHQAGRKQVAKKIFRKPTVKRMEESFGRINSVAFDGELPPCALKIEDNPKNKHQVAWFSKTSENTITFDANYKFSDAGMDCVMAHQMCHYLIRLRHPEQEYSKHDQEFKDVARMVTRKAQLVKDASHKNIDRGDSDLYKPVEPPLPVIQLAGIPGLQPVCTMDSD